MPVPYLGASATWIEEDEAVTLAHVRRAVAEHLRKRLLDRVEVLDQIDVSTDDVLIEIRAQMADCAVRGDVAYASELADMIWDLLAWRDEAHSS